MAVGESIELEHVGARVLATRRYCGIARDEWFILEISPEGEFAKVRNLIAETEYWIDVHDFRVLEILDLDYEPTN